jgi:hypothetical protein
MSISLEGLMNVGGDETRALAMVKVNHQGQDYDWQIFIPQDANLSEYVANAEANIKADIDAKKAVWAALEPKTREIPDPITGQTQIVDIDESEIVRPDIPDYYARRRSEYPSIGDQLDALWKGGQAAQNMMSDIQAVKDRYPKP